MSDSPIHTRNLCQRIGQKIKNVIRSITVEPDLFVLFICSGLDHTTLDQMQIQKSCKIDFGFNDTVCDNLVDDKYKEEDDLVQDEV